MLRPVTSPESYLMNALLRLSPVLAQSNVDENTGLGIIAWIVVGLIAGFLASKIVNKRGEGILLDIVLGLVGSVVGGFLFHLLGIHRNGSFIFSIIVATIGAVLVLVIYHKLIRAGSARA
jgi:uncharacterized membrane protein YeaQ/YmgE (transglycosylase-associated protein family)